MTTFRRIGTYRASFVDHVAWSQEFPARIEKRANSDLFRSLATLTFDFLHGQK